MSAPYDRQAMIKAKKDQIAKQSQAPYNDYRKQRQEKKKSDSHTVAQVCTMIKKGMKENNNNELFHGVFLAHQKGMTFDDGLMADAEAHLKEIISIELNKRLDNMDEKDLWATWTKVYRLMSNCERLNYQDLPAFKKAKDKADEMGLSMDLKMDLLKYDLGKPGVEHFQQIFDKARCTSFDERMSLSKFIVEKVLHVRHEQTHAEYVLHRNKLKEKIDAEGAVEKITVASQAAIGPSLDEALEQCDPAYNEFYLFHGTSIAVTDLITDGDFLIKTAADHGWTFGKGIYAAEFANHAQFFAEQVAGDGGGTFAILMCRAFCGRCTDCGEWPETTQRCDKADEAEKAIEDGKAHSTRGSEWPGCYDLREFVLPDDDQILPEFIILGHSE